MTEPTKYVCFHCTGEMSVNGSLTWCANEKCPSYVPLNRAVKPKDEPKRDYKEIRVVLHRTEDMVHITYDALHVVQVWGYASQHTGAAVDLALHSLREAMVDALEGLKP